MRDDRRGGLGGHERQEQTERDAQIPAVGISRHRVAVAGVSAMAMLVVLVAIARRVVVMGARPLAYG